MKSLLLAACLLAAVACGDDDDSRPPDCVEIVEACHPKDPGSGPIHDCHINAEDTWTAAECGSNKASCLTLCAGTPDGGGPDAGGADAAAHD